MNIKLAIASPHRDIYSETFIQAHKHLPGAQVSFYYGGWLPTMLEGKGGLAPRTIWERTFNRLIAEILPSPLFIEEKAFARSLRREKIECVLAEYGPTGVGVLKVCKRLGLPLLVHFHGYDAFVHQIIEQYETGYKEMFQYAAAVFVVSRAMQKRVEELGCPPDKIRYNPYGPHDSFLKIEPRLEEKVFVSVGRFIDKKAPYYTLLAFKEAANRHPDARLVIAGEGVLLNACKNLARHLNIEGAVSFPGVISRDEFIRHLRIARAYVQHSITALDGDMEGTPVSILEASAAGVPVISTRHAGIPEVIRDGETGLLVDEHDVEGMSRHMLRLLEDRRYAKTLGSRGKAFIAENFNLDRHLSSISQTIVHSLPRRS
ncbi:MAG: glycosyltransferase [Chloroflexi bacterium]|nr:glycosyltransferase [Chloroflexota bacterium]